MASTVFSNSSKPMAPTVPQSPLLYLPTEIRLMIYELLLLPQNQSVAAKTTSAASDYYEYERSAPAMTTDSGPMLLS
ncbi:hypothetical protein LTR66_015386, partial [Elasticomyces elasticus]